MAEKKADDCVQVGDHVLLCAELYAHIKPAIIKNNKE
jgi:hypothetical protein